MTKKELEAFLDALGTEAGLSCYPALLGPAPAVF